MYCMGCGNKLPQNAKFCQHCGKSTSPDIENIRTEPAPGDKTTPVSDTATASSRGCPQCGRDDKVAKVSAIVASQTREISGGSWQTNTYVDNKGKKRSEDHYAPYSATESSVLAKRLASPEKPDAGFNLGAIVAVAFLGLTGCCTCQILREVDMDDTFSSFILLIIPAILGIIGIVIFMVTNPKHQKRVAQVQQVELPRWEKAMAQWNQLYYCSRDDGVFNPNERVFVPIDQMTNYLFPDSEQTSP